MLSWFPRTPASGRFPCQCRRVYLSRALVCLSGRPQLLPLRFPPLLLLFETNLSSERSFHLDAAATSLLHQHQIFHSVSSIFRFQNSGTTPPFRSSSLECYFPEKI